MWNITMIRTSEQKIPYNTQLYKKAISISVQFPVK